MVETLDHLAGSWKIYQLKGGHRFSADDVLTAWTAARVCPQAREILDLGSGLGSVGLLTLYRLPEAVLTGVEVQEISYSLASKTVAQAKRRIFVFYFIVGILGSFLGQFAILYLGIDEILDKIADFRPFFDLLAAYVGSFVLVTMVHFIKPT